MAIFDFTPVQSLLGREVCFRDLAFENQLQEYEPSLRDSDLFKEFSGSAFKFGRVAGCCADIGESGGLDFSILLDDDYFRLSELELLFVS